jgi:steroid delta-isomerase-like uncharacterized protein
MERRHFFAGLGLAVGAAGPAHAADSTSRDLIERFAATLTARDIAAFAALFADDYAQHQTSAAAPPPPAGISGKQATENYFAARLAALPDLVVTIEAMVATPDMAAASFLYTGTQRGPYFGQPATNKKISFNSCDIFGIRDGKFVAHWGAADIAGILAQIRA